MGIKVQTFSGGYDANFLYLVWCEKTKRGVIVDTALEPEEIFAFAEKEGIKIEKAVVMHSHFDHIVALEQYKEKGVTVLGHEATKVNVDQRVKEGDVLTFGKESLKVLHTPGHRYDCICLYGNGKLFTSDTLFVHTYGRCDLEGSEPSLVYESLHKLIHLPEKTVVYPGHDYGPTPISTLAEEKKFNIFFLYRSKKEFLDSVQGQFTVL